MTDNATAYLHSAPWDATAFGHPAWQLRAYSAAALAAADAVPGHQSLSVDPLSDKRLLRQHGFEYAATLLQAVAGRAQLRQLKPLDGHNMSVAAKIVAIRRETSLDAILPICRAAFADGRLQHGGAAGATAALFYERWLHHLAAAGQVFGLYAECQLAGFIATEGHALALSAVAPAYRGKGLARYWWRQVIAALLASGHDTVSAPVPAANASALNLYATQGFSFRAPQEIYQRVVW